MPQQKLITRRARKVARFLGADRTRRLFLTYGTTSSINLAAYSFASCAPGDEVLISILEHHSNIVPWQRLAERRGRFLRSLPMTADGRLDLDQLEASLTERWPAGCADPSLQRQRRCDRCRRRPHRLPVAR